MTQAMLLPELGENIQTAQVVRVLVSVGDTVRADQAVLEVETDKATAEVPCPFPGVVREVHVAAGQEVLVGQPILTLETAAEVAGLPSRTAAEPPAAPGIAAAGQTETTRILPAGPMVRRVARELGVDLREIRGAGPEGRIMVDDVKDHVRRSLAQGAPHASGEPTTSTTPAVGPAAALELPDFARFGKVRREPLSNIRRRIGERMSFAWSRIPHVTQFDRADVSELEEQRHRFAPRVEAAGGKLTMTAIVLKVAAAALRVFPRFNASLDEARAEIVYKEYVHVGVAVDTEHGLLVPVIRDADRKNIVQIALELSHLAGKARERKLSLEELRGGTFSLTNLGGLGTTYFSPIVNWPEVAVLGVGRSELQPTYREGALAGRRILPLSLSYDHRVNDGADAARFLRWIAEALERPLLLALEG
jgi:pyruvate dehydrogenase E2 component (dihydrolipoamide acetyltransferase)